MKTKKSEEQQLPVESPNFFFTAEELKGGSWTYTKLHAAEFLLSEAVNNPPDDEDERDGLLIGALENLQEYIEEQKETNFNENQEAKNFIKE